MHWGDNALNKQRRLVGIIVSEPDRSFFQASVSTIQKELFAADMDVAIFSTLLTRSEEIYTDAENAVFDIINYDLIDGLIVYIHTLNCDKIVNKIIDKLRNCGKPVVFLEQPAEGFECSPFDNDCGAELLLSHLSQVHNIKNAAYISGPVNSGFHNRILESFMSKIGKYGISIKKDDIYHGKDWTYDYGPIVQSVIDKGLPDAVICCSDFTASAVIGELTARGIKVPADVIVTGYSKNEPFRSDYFNITSVTRNPEAMSANAARRIISQLNGTEYIPYSDIPSCTMEEGSTCGCAEINYGDLAKSAMDSMIATRREGFDSYYNFMSEELIGATDFEDYLWKLDWYTFYLGNFQGFWLCLNENVMHTSIPSDGYTDRIDLPYIKFNDSRTVDFNRGFDKSVMLPEIFVRRDKPCAYIFNSLHFANVNFGYTVISYGDSGECYDMTFAKWLRYVTCALEKHHRQIVYNDAVTDTQIRDQLTGLLNMKGFKRTMTESFEKLGGKDKLLRIISVDVANLSGINTAYGYSEGDRLLQKLSVILNNCAGDDDICVRVSGDEFIICGVLDSDVPVDEVPTNLERNINAYNSSAGAEYGIHIYTSRVTAPFTSADVLNTLPYEASYQRTLTKDNHNKARKISHGAKNEEFDPEERKYVSRMLNDNLFAYHFQPIVNAKTGEIVAYEALMRSGGEVKISPIAILNHADALGRLGDVERHTMTNLFSFRYENSELFHNKMLFINSIPSCTLPDKDFDELYAKYGSIMDKVVVEFTEHTEADAEQLQTILNRSRKLGFQIAIDDYGTGYSNISNLLTFMPNCVKIDRSLIMNIHADKRKQHFTQNIIDYAHDNNFSVLAEGVELPEELKMVIAMGVDLIQGYYTAKPSPEVITEIRPEIADEIRDLNRINEKHRARKTYFTGSESEISLISLDFDSFTDIFVNSERYTINGANDHISETVIRIKDGLDCTLDLVNVSMKNEHAENCIILGKNSRLTLNIVGNVSIQGAINVPVTSEINIVGDGTLSISSASSQSYGIGTSVGHSHGNINIQLNNKLFIHLDSDKCIAIGGGDNSAGSKIKLDTKEIDIELSGNQVVGVGSLYGSANVEMNGTKLTIKEQCSQGIGVGSFLKSMDIDITDCEINVESSGNGIAGICAYTVKNSSVNINNTEINMLFKGKKICGIGSEEGAALVTMHDCGINIVCEGAEAVAMGSSSKETKIAFYECKGIISVTSGNGADLLVPKEYLIYKNSDLQLFNNP